MGKDLRGKELGIGICQRKDGYYTARYVSKNGKKAQRYFKKLQECRKWLADEKYKNEHSSINAGADMTVDTWFNYWIDVIKGDNIRTNTKLGYKQRYNQNIKPVIGDMLLSELKPLHCQGILTNMSSKYKNSTIANCRMVMNMLFGCAVENEMMLKNPITKNVKCTSGKKSGKRKAMTLEQQRFFLQNAKDEKNYNEYAFVLQTGLRVGELTALQWCDVDFKNCMIHISRNMGYRYDTKEWEIGAPKTDYGYRDIPLTKEAIRILQNQKEKIKKFKIQNMQYPDLIFVDENGNPIRRCDYDVRLRRLCKKIGMDRVSMHIFRHTFATRCIEAGMKPKTLQVILGHSKISTTLDLYVDISSDVEIKDMSGIENALKVV